MVQSVEWWCKPGRGNTEPVETICITGGGSPESRFQAQELITVLPGSWIFKPGETPRFVWRIARV